MHKRKVLFLIIIFILAGAAIFLVGVCKFNSSNKVEICNFKSVFSKNLPQEPDIPLVQEKITYDVSLGKLRLGRAVFNSIGNVPINGDPYLITFETRLARFMDLEKIYCDPKTFLPLKIERSIRNWFNSEQITEVYDQHKFILQITKNNKEPLVITKQGPIHNAILLPFFVRRIPELDIGWSLLINLPVRSYTIKLVSIDELKVPAGRYTAYHFKSEPKQFEIWISVDEKRIPLKIEGFGALGYSLAMKEYSGQD